jgi:hypothetical protein
MSLTDQQKPDRDKAWGSSIVRAGALHRKTAGGTNREEPRCLAGRPILGGGRLNRKASAQATSGSNHAARRVKLQGGGIIDLGKGAGASLEIWSWAQQGARGKQKTWQLRSEAL